MDEGQTLGGPVMDNIGWMKDRHWMDQGWTQYWIDKGWTLGGPVMKNVGWIKDGHWMDQ